MLVSFLGWWYGRGWRQVANSFKPRLQGVADSFSVNLLIPTLLEPWRRIVTNPGRSLEEKWRAWADNTFSRIVGFVVRSFVLLVAGFTLIVVAVLTVIEMIIWPLVPLALPGFIVAGVLA
ncbi:MAG TPA: hypothetical protein VH234_01185 [Candidatus Saccharimonadales bacterium]|nr:hypothetical protein [Candidatus Saccharimonadales bacterium]